MEAELIGISGLGGTALVWAIVQGLRGAIGTNIIRDSLTPPLAVAVGIGLNCLLKLDNVADLAEASWTGTVLLGIMAGLSASGIHSFGKKVLNGG
ncbi:hypothetical protein LCGC14_1957350 [marine sediment metagenome]|uniref:Holin n=1 Tax=marine sediment metagenome TaxID=412755 RepID=A0A0F9ICQ3_9ZZZZ